MRLLKLLYFVLKAFLFDMRSFANSMYSAAEEANRKRYVKVKKGFKKGLPTIDLLDLLPDFNESIRNYTYIDGTSRVTDIALLKSLAKGYKDCQYLEIGSFRGESLVNVADVAAECLSISLSDKEMHDLGLSEYVKVQRFFSKELKNVQHINHNSLTFNFSDLNKKFDIIFIDGDHSYQAVKKDTENAFKLLKNENSIIVWHDYGLSYNLENWTTIAAMIDGTPADKRDKIYHVSNTICSVYINKTFDTSFPETTDLPNKTFDMTISAKKI